MGFWFFLFAFLGSALLGELLRPDPKVNHAKSAGLGDFGFPTVSESRPVPVIFGRVLISGANVVWYGRFSSVPVINSQRVKTGLFSKKTINQIVAWRYFIDVHAALGHAGIQSIRRFRVAERDAFLGNVAANVSQAVNQPNLFGGTDKDGGYVGTFRLRSGTQTTFAGVFRGYQMLSVFDWTGEIGTNPYVKEWSFEAERIPAALGFGAIGSDANGAEIIYETLTNNQWGAGIPTSQIDTTKFQTAAGILLAEGLGTSLQWDQRRTFEDFIGEVLRHIDAVLFIDPSTGLYRLELIRDPGDPLLLPLFDESSIESVSNFSRTALDQTTNEVKVVHPDRSRIYKDATITVQDTANFESQGRAFSTQIQFPGFAEPSVANAAAWRELRALSIPVAKGTIRVNRNGHLLYPGAPYRLSWADYGIAQLVMRVNRIRYGSLESGMLEVETAQDVFSFEASIFEDPDPNEWINPIGAPAPFTIQELDEMPYQFMADPDQVAIYGDPAAPRLDARAVKPTASTYEYQVDTRLDAAPDFDLDRGVHDGFAPSAQLRDPYPASTDPVDESGTLVLELGQDMALILSTTDAEILAEAVNLAYLGPELIAFRTITDNLDGTFTLDGVYRGLWDTTPRNHAPGARFWGWYYGRTWSLDTWPAGSDVRAKLIPTTPLGQLARAAASELARVLTGRAARPLPPGNTRMNGIMWPVLVHQPGDPGDQDDLLTGPLVVSWTDRNRLAQLAGVVTQAAGSIGPEPGTTYTLRIYDEDDLIARTETGLPSPSYTYPVDTELADTGRINERLRFELESVRGGSVSHQLQERVGDFTGYGMHYGENYGGI